MTILQQPDALSFSMNLKPFKISTSVEVEFSLSQGGETLLTEILSPDEDGLIELSLRDIIHDRLSCNVPPTSDPYQQTSVVSDFTAVIGSTSVTFRVIRGGVDRLADTVMGFVRANFLTWQPNVKPVTYSSPEFLSYYAVDSGCTLKVKAYFTDASGNVTPGAEKTICNLVQNVVTTVPVQYALIAGLYSGNLPVYYDVWVASGSTALTYTQRYYAGAMRSEEEQWVFFENSLGGIDTFRTFGAVNMEAKHGHHIAEIDDVAYEYRVDTERYWTVNTGHLDVRERRWLLDFFPSEGKYIYAGSAVRRIVITDDSVAYRYRELPSSYSFTFRFAETLPLLNLPRHELPVQMLDVTVPDVGSFSLPPRLLEFSRLPLSEGVLFPVQSPYSEEWEVTTMASIFQYVASHIDIPSPGLDRTGLITLLSSQLTPLDPLHPDASRIDPSWLPEGYGTIDIGHVTGLREALNFKLDTRFFSSVFTVFDANGHAIVPNTYDQVANNLKIMVGAWTDQYLSALGLNSQSSGGGGGTVTGISIGGELPPYTPTDGIVDLPAYPVVPTKTSDLNNDSGYITQSSLNNYVTSTYLTANYYTKTEADSKFMTIAAFENLFNALNSSNVKVNHPYSSGVASIKALVGLWTEQYLSALGLNSSGGGGGIGDVTGIRVSSTTVLTPTDGVVDMTDYITTSTQRDAWTNAMHTHSNKSVLDGITSTMVAHWNAVYSIVPSAAFNTGNELADKAFVNSSISTATATFRGTVTAVNDTDSAAATALSSITTKDLNDYAFVKVENTPQTGVDKYKRYKYDGTNWVYEYTLNNSSFTSDQWSAINSGITQAIVSTIVPNTRSITAGTGLTGGGNLQADRTISLATSGVSAGTYRSVTVDTYGRVTAGTNPTTISGYGITDAKISNGVITLGGNTITPVTSIAKYSDEILSIVKGIATDYLDLSHQHSYWEITDKPTDLEEFGLLPELKEKFVTVEWFNQLFQAKDSNGNTINVNASGTVASIKSLVGLWTEQYLSALGQNASGGSGSGVDLSDLWNSLTNEVSDNYSTTKIHTNHIPDVSSIYGYLKSADLNGYVNDIATTGSGNAVTAVSKSGSVITFTKGSTFLTSHQTLYTLSIYGGTTKVLDFKPNADASIYIKAGGDISLTNDTTNKYITLSYSHPTNGANTTISAADGKVLSAITVNSLGHVTSISSKTLAAADIPDISATYATSSRVTTLEGYFTNGVAKEAAKLSTVSKTAWGQTFWTSGGVPDSISGNMTSVGDITPSDNGKSLGTSSARFAVYGTSGNYSGNVSISGTLGVTGATTLSSTLGVTGATTLSSTLSVASGIILTTTKKITFGTGSSAPYIEVDSDGYFHFSAGLYSDSFVSALGQNTSGGTGGGGTVTGIIVGSGNPILPDANGSVTIPAYPDVPSWAMQSTKPTYTWTEIQDKPSWIGASKPTYSLSEISGTTDLQLIEALTGSGLLKRNSNNTWSLDTNTYLTTHQTIYSLTLKADGNTVTNFTPNSAAASFEIAAGANISITRETNKITIANTYSYTLPLAASGTRGGVQIGFTTDTANRNYAVQLSSEKMYVNVPWTDTTYSAGGGISFSGTVISNTGVRSITQNSSDKSVLVINTNGTTDYYDFSHIHTWYDIIDRPTDLYGYGVLDELKTDFVTIATTQTITGAKTFSALMTANGNITTGTSNGAYIQIGAIKLVYDSTNNALKVIKSDDSAANFYATGAVSALGVNTSGGGGGAGIDLDAMWGSLMNTISDTYASSKIATAHIPDMASTYGYVKSSGVTSVSTGTGLTGGTITSTGTISINSTYQTYISHGESAYNSLSNYLPLSGGTLSSSNPNVLSINSTNTHSYIYFKVNDTNKASVGYYSGLGYVANETTYARIGVNDSGTPQYWSSTSSSTAQTLYHSGNLSIGTLMGSSATGGATTPIYWSGSAWITCTPYANASVNYATSAGSASSATSANTANVAYNPYTRIEGSSTSRNMNTDLAGGGLFSNYYGGSNSNYPPFSYGNVWQIEGTQVITQLAFEVADTNGSGTVWHRSGTLANAAWRRLLSSDTTGNNFTAPGELTASSDERLKTVVGDATMSVGFIANAPNVLFKWKDNRDDKVYGGSIAQYYLQNNAKCFVRHDDEYYSLNYGALGVSMAISIAKVVVTHEDRIAALEKENRSIKAENMLLKDRVADLERRLVA